MSNKEIPAEVVATKILLVRGSRVMLGSDLASLYGIETKNLNLQAKRNIKRFPDDFMFQLTKRETLRLHSATSKRGGRRYLPYVFTKLINLYGAANVDEAFKIVEQKSPDNPKRIFGYVIGILDKMKR
jgi:hypothetical protein